MKRLRRWNATFQSALVAVVALDGYFGKCFHVGGVIRMAGDLAMLKGSGTTRQNTGSDRLRI